MYSKEQNNNNNNNKNEKQQHQQTNKSMGKSRKIMRLLNQTNSMELSFKKLFQLKHSKKKERKWKRK